MLGVAAGWAWGWVWGRCGWRRLGLGGFHLAGFHVGRFGPHRRRLGRGAGTADCSQLIKAALGFVGLAAEADGAAAQT